MSEEIRTFESLLKHTVVDPDVLAENLERAKDVTKDYLILFGARTGSTWLTHLLSNNIGIPDEYINPEFMSQSAIAAGAKGRYEFIQGLRGLTHSNGVFGIEATCEHIEIFDERAFFTLLPNLTVFHLWRENLVAQSVSIYRAVMTGRYHSIDGGPTPEPHYDAEEMANWYQYMARVENGNVELMLRRGLSPINITYETLFENKYVTRDLFFKSLGVVPNYIEETAEGRIEKVSSEWNKLVEARFRAEFSDLVEFTERGRLPKRLQMASVL